MTLYFSKVDFLLNSFRLLMDKSEALKENSQS